MGCLKGNTKGWIWLIAIILVILFILGNALLGYHASHTLSGWLLELLGFENSAGTGDGDFWLRKLAHITEYGALGFLAILVKNYHSCRNKTISIWFPMFCILGVGVLDEFFQSFGNRTSAVSDILLDFAGGMLGMLLAIGICKVIKMKKTDRSGDKCNE